MDRKEFLKSGCTACLCAAAAMLLPATQGCSPAYSVFNTVPVSNKIEVPLSLFEKGSLQLVRPKGWLYDIAVQKKTDGTFDALLMQCTHMENQLTPAQNGFSCSLHGSRFAADGKVLKGPAEINLRKYNTVINNSSVIITI